jgi:hypothetical protein
MRYFAKRHTSGEAREWTEEEVRREIIETMQHDMSVVIGEDMSDAEIDKAVMEHIDLADYLEHGYFDGINHEITSMSDSPARKFQVTIKLPEYETWIVDADTADQANAIMDAALSSGRLWTPGAHSDLRKLTGARGVCWELAPGMTEEFIANDAK